MVMNSQYRRPLPGTDLDYFDTQSAVDAIKPGAYAALPFTSKVLAENLVRRCPPEQLTASLQQIIERKRDLDFPWFPARVVCHDILGQTAFVDLAGLRDAIADKGGDPAQINPVVPTQLIVDHSLAVEHAGFEKDAFEKTGRLKTAATPIGFASSTGVKPPSKTSMWCHQAMASCTRSIWNACHRWCKNKTAWPSQTPW